MQKIDEADAVYVVNPKVYVRRSVCLDMGIDRPTALEVISAGSYGPLGCSFKESV